MFLCGRRSIQHRSHRQLLRSSQLLAWILLSHLRRPYVPLPGHLVPRRRQDPTTVCMTYVCFQTEELHSELTNYSISRVSLTLHKFQLNGHMFSQLFFLLLSLTLLDLCRSFAILLCSTTILDKREQQMALIIAIEVSALRIEVHYAELGYSVLHLLMRLPVQKRTVQFNAQSKFITS